ncbi:MAG: glycoside hydrolase family 127 protein, partial [Armatimonadetes bacterium]|nr:glycoside hydrolase family 127 protein [Armatimonadota bacterium]
MTRTRSLLLLLCVAPVFAAGGKRVLRTFDYHGVSLDDGLLRRQLDEVKDCYLRIPNDDLLKGFRARAGRPAPGVDLGGWYSGDVFHIFGQILSGLARLFAATGDPACRDKAEALLAGWAECIAPDGYFHYTAKPNAPHYIYDKMVGGLVDMHLYCGSRSALDHLSRITDWAIKDLGRNRPYADGSSDTEWYTLSENLYRAWLVTGDAKYRDFAGVWEYTEYWDLYANRLDLFGKRANGGQTGAYHAYSHVNTLGGSGAAYLVTGEQHYLDTLVNAYDYLQSNECFATGGYGPNEQLLPADRLPQTLLDTNASSET